MYIFNFFLDIVNTKMSDKISEGNKFHICKYKQEVQGLQAFAFSVVTVNDEYRKPGFKAKRRD